MSIDKAATPIRHEEMTKAEFDQLSADALAALDRAHPAPDRAPGALAADQRPAHRAIKGVAGD